MKTVQTIPTEIRGYISPTPGLPIERQRQMAHDHGCKHVYEHRAFAAGEHSQLDRWMQSLRAGDTAWLPSVLCLVIPAKHRPSGYRPLAGMSVALNRILAAGAIVVDARAGVSSADPEQWAKHVDECSRRVSAGTRTKADRIKALKNGRASALPGVKARWNAPIMAARLAMQKVIWTGSGSETEARALLDADLKECSTRTLYSLLGPRRPYDPKAGGRPPHTARKRPPRVRYVYFIQRGRAREVKIGSAYDVASRFSSLRTSSPDDLRLIGVLAGDDTTEHAMHTQFADLRIRREWFRLEGDLVEFIKQLPKQKSR